MGLLKQIIDNINGYEDMEIKFSNQNGKILPEDIETMQELNRVRSNLKYNIESYLNMYGDIHEKNNGDIH